MDIIGMVTPENMPVVLMVVNSSGGTSDEGAARANLPPNPAWMFAFCYYA